MQKPSNLVGSAGNVGTAHSLSKQGPFEIQLLLVLRPGEGHVTWHLEEPFGATRSQYMEHVLNTYYCRFVVCAHRSYSCSHKRQRICRNPDTCSMAFTHITPFGMEPASTATTGGSQVAGERPPLELSAPAHASGNLALRIMLGLGARYTLLRKVTFLTCFPR